jgi:uncharacterized protein (TIGR02145 family)
MKPLSWIVLLLTISTFSQTPGGGVTDIDGNRYNSVIIGTQEWMKENLNVSKYSDGTIIPQVTDPVVWRSLNTGAWCYYNNDSANGAVYGKLYNWYAVAGINDAASLVNPSLRKQLAPTGWHVPSTTEWAMLIYLLDPNYSGVPFGTYTSNSAGGKLKETGNLHWNTPNSASTNTTGFTALPAGWRQFQNSSFGFLGTEAWMWLSSIGDEWNVRQEAWYVYLGGGSSVQWDYQFYGDLKAGYSVRAIKNPVMNNQSFEENSFKVYPNPAREQITIDLGTNSNAIGWSYKIVNTLGQEVLNGVLSSQQNIIALNNIKGQGVYFVKVSDGSNALLDTKKIIIQQ